MASAQDAVRKEEAAINELVEQAKAARPQDEMIFGGWLHDKRITTSMTPLYLYDERIWSGNFYRKYPDVLRQPSSFVQTEKNENGIKSAVIYSNKTLEGHREYGYLLAWSDSYNEGKHTRKVYGYCGLLKIFRDIDWDKVEKDLDNSSSSFSYTDPITGTCVKAEIHANVVFAEFK